MRSGHLDSTGVRTRTGQPRSGLTGGHRGPNPEPGRGGRALCSAIYLRYMAASGCTAALGQQTAQALMSEQCGECFYKGNVTAQLTSAVGVDEGSKSREHKIKKHKDTGEKK